MLAIGIRYEHDGFCSSRVTNLTDRKEISAFLRKEFGVEFDEILLVQDDQVIDHWRLEGGE